MNVTEDHPRVGRTTLSVIHRQASLTKPLLVADWLGALFLNYEIDAGRLQPFVPFNLDLWNGRAFVSLVAFTMRGMRLARLGALGAWVCKPIATHEFLNLRAYVRHGDDAAICFLAEWLPNRLSVLCGPLLYALPYRHASIQYGRAGPLLRGTVVARKGRFQYEGKLHNQIFRECGEGSLDHFLIERYMAFNAGHFTPAQPNVTRRRFRVWHEPWRQVRAEVCVRDDTLPETMAPWWRHAQFVSANYSPGVCDVRMSAPQRVRKMT
jgi:uncharacterized protein